MTSAIELRQILELNEARLNYASGILIIVLLGSDALVDKADPTLPLALYMKNFRALAAVVFGCEILRALAQFAGLRCMRKVERAKVKKASL